MSFNAPTKLVFYICTFLFVVALIANFVSIPFISEYKFVISMISLCMLEISCILKGF